MAGTEEAIQIGHYGIIGLESPKGSQRRGVSDGGRYKSFRVLEKQSSMTCQGELLQYIYCAFLSKATLTHSLSSGYFLLKMNKVMPT